jgi:hypothetical protein
MCEHHVTKLFGESIVCHESPIRLPGVRVSTEPTIGYYTA